MSSPLYSLAALFTSVLLLISGNALISIVIPVRAALDGFGDLAVGLLGSAYFAGMLAGALQAPAIVARVGHIRAFAASVAIAAAVTDVLPAMQTLWAWLILRAILGFVLASVYAIIESWVNGLADNSNRGALYAVYQIVNFSASSIGQLLMRFLDPTTGLPFVVATALSALAIVPISFTRSEAPPMPRAARLDLPSLRKLAPLALIGAFVAGACNGASISLAPIYALQTGVSPMSVPYFTSAIVIGSALGVYPAGWLSDRIDRRVVLTLLMAIGALIEFAIAFLGPGGPLLISLGFLVGLTTFTLYTLAVSLANDDTSAADMVVVSSGLLFVYCIAAIASPALAAFAMRQFGPGALYLQNGMFHGAMALIAGRSLRMARSRIRPRSR